MYWFNGTHFKIMYTQLALFPQKTYKNPPFEPTKAKRSHKTSIRLNFVPTTLQLYPQSSVVHTLVQSTY